MDFSRITDDLFIGTTPAVGDYGRLHDLGVQMVINMRFEHRPVPDVHVPPLDFLWLRTIDSPLFPIPIRVLVRGARISLGVMCSGGNVYVHCAGGRHRGVAMGAAILIAQGYDPEAAMELIKTRRPIADPYAFYIRRCILRFANHWQGI